MLKLGHCINFLISPYCSLGATLRAFLYICVSPLNTKQITNQFGIIPDTRSKQPKIIISCPKCLSFMVPFLSVRLINKLRFIGGHIVSKTCF